MENITYNIRRSVAINIADQAICENKFGLSKRYAKLVADGIGDGFKPGDLVGYSKIIKKLPPAVFPMCRLNGNR